MSEQAAPEGDTPAPKRPRKQAAEPAPASTPETIRRNVIVLAEGLGVTAPADAGKRPAVDIDWPYPTLGREFGLLARSSNLYLRGDALVTVDCRNGNVRAMDPLRFCSWADSLAWPFKMTGRAKGESVPRYARLSPALAAVILSTDEFRNEARELRAVYEMPLPAWRGEGEARTIELLAPGYDAAAKVLVLGTLDFHREQDPGEAQSWLLDVLREMPWAELADDPSAPMPRSLAVHVAAMLAPFCALLIGEHARRPMFCYIADQVGSGKTMLAKMALAPVFGEPSTIPVSDNRADELEKKIESAILAQLPYLFLDDCKRFKSGVMNSLLTSGRVSSRKMGGNEMPPLPNRMQIYATGNGLELSADLDRRAMIADLFFPGEALTRKFHKPITEEWLFARETRARFLAALWALVRHWRDAHKCRRFEEAQRASFETFAATVGSIVIGASFANPFGPRTSTLGGDEETAALLSLVISIVDKEEEDRDITRREIMEQGAELGILGDIVGDRGDLAKRLGNKLRMIRGKPFRDSKGRKFTLGHRKGSKGLHVYPLEFVKD